MFAPPRRGAIRRLFRQARKESPAIIFNRQLDAVGATRGKDISGEKDQTLNQLLVELDGFAERDQIVSRRVEPLDKLDTALLRPGRFDRQISCRHPTSRPPRDPRRAHPQTSRSPRTSTSTSWRARPAA